MNPPPIFPKYDRRSRRGPGIVAGFLLRAIVGLSAFAGSIVPAHAVSPSSGTAAAWRELGAARYREALASFRRLQKAESGSTPEARVGEAMALLNLQPVTASNRAEARAICAAVAAGAPEDPWTAQAHFLIGRIATIHTTPTDFAGARLHYRWLIDRQPGSELGQIAFVKYATLQLTEPVADDELRRRYESLVALEPQLTEPSARRDFHLVLADACLYRGLGPEAALRHSLVAEAAGVQQPIRTATLLVRIAELSRTLGLKSQARRYYQRFLDEVGTSDLREKLVRERLVALGSEVGP